MTKRLSECSHKLQCNIKNQFYIRYKRGKVSPSYLPWKYKLFLTSYYKCLVLCTFRFVAAKRDLAHIFSSFQIISYSKGHLCPLQILSYALEIRLSIMEIQWPEFLIMHT